MTDMIEMRDQPSMEGPNNPLDAIVTQAGARAILAENHIELGVDDSRTAQQYVVELLQLINETQVQVQPVETQSLARLPHTNERQYRPYFAR